MKQLAILCLIIFLFLSLSPINLFACEGGHPESILEESIDQKILLAIPWILTAFYHQYYEYTQYILPQTEIGRVNLQTYLIFIIALSFLALLALLLIYFFRFRSGQKISWLPPMVLIILAVFCMSLGRAISIMPYWVCNGKPTVVQTIFLILGDSTTVDEVKKMRR